MLVTALAITPITSAAMMTGSICTFFVITLVAACQPIPWRYVGWAGVYVLLHMTFCSLIAVLLFGGREVGEETLS